MRHLLYLLISAALVMALGCDNSSNGEPQCGLVKIAKGCKAQCARLDTTSKPTKVCIKQLISRTAGENPIMQSDIKKVRTLQLPAEVCFPVIGDAPSDPAMVERLSKTCQGG